MLVLQLKPRFRPKQNVIVTKKRTFELNNIFEEQDEISNEMLKRNPSRSQRWQ